MEDMMNKVESFLQENNQKCQLNNWWTNYRYTWMKLFSFLLLLEIYSTLESLWLAIEVKRLLIIQMELSFTWIKYWRKKKLEEFQLIQVAKYLMSICKIRKFSCRKILERKKIKFLIIKIWKIICHKDK